MPQCASTTALVEHCHNSGAARVELMQAPRPPSPRETTEAMVRNIGREMAEIQRAIGRCRGDAVAEPELTGTWMAHLLICSKELLHNLLIDTAPRPRRIEPWAAADPRAQTP